MARTRPRGFPERRSAPSPMSRRGRGATLAMTRSHWLVIDVAGAAAPPAPGHCKRSGEMAVLVTAASKHGATVEIANVIARKLNEHGASAELVDIEDMSELDCYEAVVIGSGIYLGNWLKEARRVIDPMRPSSPSDRPGCSPAAPIVGDPPVAYNPNALPRGRAARSRSLCRREGGAAGRSTGSPRRRGCSSLRRHH